MACYMKMTCTTKRTAALLLALCLLSQFPASAYGKTGETDEIGVAEASKTGETDGFSVAEAVAEEAAETGKTDKVSAEEADWYALLMAVTDSPYEEEIYQWLMENLGLNAAAVCGIMANIYAESGFLPTNLQNYYEKKLGFTDKSYTEAVDSGTYGNFVHDKAGYGLCQWTYWSRKEGLLDAARSRAASVGDLRTQLEYLRSELPASLLRALRALPDTAAGAYEAASLFCLEFERPDNTQAAAVVRGELARDIYFAEYGPEEPGHPEAPDTHNMAVACDGGIVTVTARPGADGTAVYCALYGEGGQFLAFDAVCTPTDVDEDTEAEYRFDFRDTPFHSVKTVLVGEDVPLCAVYQNTMDSSA